MTIKSKFLHIFLVVQRCASKTPGVRRYRVSVISNEDVPEFGPDVPKPAEFDEGDEFKHFLFSKSKPLCDLDLDLSCHLEMFDIPVSRFPLLYSDQWRECGLQGAQVPGTSCSCQTGVD